MLIHFERQFYIWIKFYNIICDSKLIFLVCEHFTYVLVFSGQCYMWSWFFYGLNCFWWEARHNSIVSHMQRFSLTTICSEVVLPFGFQYFDYDLVGMLFLLVPVPVAWYLSSISDDLWLLQPERFLIHILPFLFFWVSITPILFL